jgi:hypothetical protein
MELDKEAFKKYEALPHHKTTATFVFDFMGFINFFNGFRSFFVCFIDSKSAMGYAIPLKNNSRTYYQQSISWDIGFPKYP